MCKKGDVNIKIENGQTQKQRDRKSAMKKALEKLQQSYSQAYYPTIDGSKNRYIKCSGEI